MAKKPKEQPPEPRESTRAREQHESDREKYRAYWLTLDPRDRERLPEP